MYPGCFPRDKIGSLSIVGVLVVVGHSRRNIAILRRYVEPSPGPQLVHSRCKIGVVLCIVGVP